MGRTGDRALALGSLPLLWVVDGKVLCWECVLLREFAVANIRNWPGSFHARFPIRRPTMPKKL